MSDAQALDRQHFLPWLIVIVPMMIIVSTVMSLAGS